MREADLVLHRKLPSKKECICGSKMSFAKDFVCNRQYRLGEPSIIVVYLPNTPIIKNGNFILK
jgi:hypothetical protein|tara:strand:- start:11276 stop:11464 length:189 start_codon:yes stop_codon:yes gene_type:complete